MSNRIRGKALQTLRNIVFLNYFDIFWLCGDEGVDTINQPVMVSQGDSNSIENLRLAHGRKSPYCVGNFSRKRGRLQSNKKVKP